MPINRRVVLFAPLVTALGLEARAQADGERHGLSLFGELGQPADFSAYAYVNPEAPKGGTLIITPSQWGFNQNPETFNSFNTFILKGDAPPGMDAIFATLMAGTADEPSTMYGYVASSVSVADGGNTLRFRLRPEARFHDGTPITAEDVAWSFMTLKQKGHPSFRMILTDMLEASAEAAGIVKVTLEAGHPRELPLTVAGLPILSKAWYASRDFEATSLEPPLGSSAYRIGRYETGRYYELERVKGWWGEKLPVNVGTDNFDIVRTEFFRDRNASFEGFKARTYTFRQESTSRMWATQYEFPAMRDGTVKREEIGDGLPAQLQGWYFNTRQAKFKDRRVREAIGLCFDFEWTNAHVMYSSYKRNQSFFENSQMKAVGPPSEAELKLLEPFRGQVPDEAFGEPWLPPVSDGSGQDRALLRRAMTLLREAGLVMKDNRLLDATGQPFTLEFMDSDPALEPHTLPFIANLKRVGIEAKVRRVDAAQYQLLLREYKFDVISMALGGSLTPGESLNFVYGSEAAKQPGSRNMAGISDPAVDALIKVIGQTRTREDLDVACRALDRVLRSGRYMVPGWYKAGRWFAWWDLFDRPARKPKYATGAPSTWWWNAEKAARLGLR